ncbi:MAG: hypothetical protein ACRDRH_28265 [Pseudonocardia sp.]
MAEREAATKARAEQAAKEADNNSEVIDEDENEDTEADEVKAPVKTRGRKVAA